MLQGLILPPCSTEQLSWQAGKFSYDCKATWNELSCEIPAEYSVLFQSEALHGLCWGPAGVSQVKLKLSSLAHWIKFHIYFKNLMSQFVLLIMTVILVFLPLAWQQALILKCQFCLDHSCPLHKWQRLCLNSNTASRACRGDTSSSHVICMLAVLFS